MPKTILAFLLLALLPVSTRAQNDGSSDPVLRLSLQRAVEIALAPEGNARVQLAKETIRQAQARSGQARAPLLPNLDGWFGAENETFSLATFGLETLPPFGIPRVFTFRFPTLVGPFTVTDTRARLRQTIFDFSVIRRFQSARVELFASKEESVNAQDQTAAQVAQLYLLVLRAHASLEAAQANVDLAEAVFASARNRVAAGTGLEIDETRAQVELSTERQRLLIAQTERERAELELLRALNAPLGTQIELTDKLTLAPAEVASPEEALTVALNSRADWKVEEKRQESARLAYSAAKWERLPSVRGFGDYGVLGSSFDRGLPTRAIGFRVSVPVFDGGMQEADRAEGLSRLREEEIRKKDLQQQIELEVREDLNDLRRAAEQVKVAEDGLTLAEDELARARRRYESGVTGSLEVTDAQSHLAQARDNRIAALFEYNMARVGLGAAMGKVRSVIQTTP